MQSLNGMHGLKISDTCCYRKVRYHGGYIWVRVTSAATEAVNGSVAMVVEAITHNEVVCLAAALSCCVASALLYICNVWTVWLVPSILYICNV